MKKESIPVFEVLDGGFFTTVQDLGRYGSQKYGVPISGAMDLFSLKIANLLVRNNIAEAALEITGLGKVKLKFLTHTVIAITGADLGPVIDTSPAPMWKAQRVNRGEVLSFQDAKRGFRAYLAVTGGIDVPLVLGSRSTYLKANIGGLEGRTLRRGDKISSFLPQISLEKIVCRRLPDEFVPDLTDEVEIGVVMGPQDDYFTEQGIKTFLNSWYEVTTESDRVGYRLEGPIIPHKNKAEIISDAIPQGAIQVPGNGLPIILMADRQVTGGYPKIACVASVDIPRVAQLKPGDKIKFKQMDVKEAHKMLNEESEKLSTIENILNRQREEFPEKRYKVKIEGKTFQVTVKEIKE